ncbi:MAG: sigma-70 family RNA polymerase sigma factor [Phycisphaerae bacterium]|nr:sigma-70 family RNA polymerase sigma factor [Phycisphaerae bacterium]
MNTTRASLLIRIRNRQDSSAWQEFDTIYRPMLRRFATLSGANSTEAEDVVQHCMIAVHQHISTFEYDQTRGRFKGWLKTLVNNRIRNLFRDRRERAADSVEFKVLSDKGGSPEELFDKVWMDEHLRYALHQVRQEVEEKTFRAFKLYVIDEMPVDEICRLLDVNANQVHKAKYRITLRLGEKMRELTDEGESAG